jgi:replicative DNA helicase
MEQQILKHLFIDEDYARKVIPFINEEFFHQNVEKVVYREVNDYISRYNALPTKEAVVIALGEKNLSEAEYSGAITSIETCLQTQDTKENLDWLLEKTEGWCQEKAVYNAVMESIQILDGNAKDKEKGSIPKILSDALGVSFDSHIGHDFLEQSDERFDFYHRVEEKIPFDLELLNDITKGGLPNKTLNIALAGTGVGKSLFMCHCAGANLNIGKNVLYITMEMAEEKIAERIDANLLDVALDDLGVLSKDMYDKKINRLQKKTQGKLVVKEFPTASAHAGHFRHLLNELNLKKNFRPDIIYIDYLNICASSRIKAGANANSYTMIKSIAEELRGLAVEFGVPIVSATQTTRSGFSNSDVGLEDTSESFGLPATADFMFALISTEELEELGQIMIKQLKNRYGDPNMHKRFVVGVDRSKMRLYDCEQDAQDELVDTGRGGRKKADDRPAFDNSSFGESMAEESYSLRKTKGRKFDGINV